MRTALIKMHLKPDNVSLTVSFGTPIIDILRPIFNFLATVQVAVVRTFFQIDRLIPESHFNSPVVIATENESGATIRLNLAILFERLPAQLSQPFLQTDFKRFLMIAQRMDLPVRTNLEIQLHSRLVIIICGVLIFPVNLVIVPTPFVFVGFCRAE